MVWAAQPAASSMMSNLVRQRCLAHRASALARLGLLTLGMLAALAALGGCGDQARPPGLDPSLEEPSPAPAARRPWPLLRKGSAGDDVVAAQLLLQHHGHAAPEDGRLGDATLAAVRAFQRASGLAVDGLVGPLTWEALIVAVAPGDESAAVRAAQHLLVRRHGFALAIDGRAGDDTIAALLQLQERACLAITGTAGVFTWSTLLAAQRYCDGGPSGKLTIAEVAALARDAGLPCGEALTIGVAIAVAESNLRGDALGRNGVTAGCPDGSADVGLWQINDCYHPEVSRACAFAAACNAAAMVDISAAGADWTPWSTYENDAYRDSLAVAHEAMEQACR